ncbi:hypothetical protein [Streptomyces sp. NBC_00078]|uniref:hypothetical protein n=1 Tax=unclassified Streptomyces TaxID=2593676 RepID=UPI00225ABA35|nr:hypothetical protein [Streptomyces sp. NBC_00078]MCX5424946.1 hypothetical protein [Streptomyces sp. NBC_00078]
MVFGLGVLAVVLVHTALHTRSHGQDSVWYGVPNAPAALSVTATCSAGSRRTASGCSR